ncbi:MAG: hypothetical protein BBJ57_07280 [Desulfobacterales bacterium PC51MH44]|nr:MAG: hypothetical protein BBJ57_07280 [Desulfobacterales bacterium PC51MH44]
MELNEKQRAVVEAMEQNILCIAPPGSGKTRVLVERAAHMIEKRKVSPYELLLLTFTRKAAGEMRARLEERIGFQAKNVTIGTFHAVALRLIQRFGTELGLRPGRITVYGDWETQFLLKDIAMELGVYKKAWKPRKKDIDAVFATYYNTGEPPDVEDPVWPLFMAFTARLKENNSLTYGSILTGLQLLLPFIGEHLKWRHIMMDESQDSDCLQWSLVENIKSITGSTLFCVADPDQAIYGWRGADVDYLVRNQGNFTTYHLNINYRSTGKIVAAANNLIKNNAIRVEKTMEACREPGVKLDVNKNLTSEGIIGLYKKVKGGPDTAILGRNHYLLEKTSRIMDEKEIPNTYIGKEGKLTNSEEFRRFHAFLKLIVNPFDNFAFLLIKDIVGAEEEYPNIRLKSAKEGKSHFQIWHDIYTASPFLRAEADVNNSLIDVATSIDQMFQRVDILEFILRWVEDNNPTGTIGEYLEWLAVYDIQDEIKENAKGVQIMTIHSAKGLEFETVIIAGMNEGILPSKRDQSAEAIEAETRLFYVAVTRAKDKLIITSRPETSEFHGKTTIEPVSRFVEWMKI